MALFTGDVVVGWISANSGKGGLDDYFLAGKKIPCDDGAESCPDKSKGGTKVKLITCFHEFLEYSYQLNNRVGSNKRVGSKKDLFCFLFTY